MAKKKQPANVPRVIVVVHKASVEEVFSDKPLDVSVLDLDLGVFSSEQDTSEVRNLRNKLGKELLDNPELKNRFHAKGKVDS